MKKRVLFLAGGRSGEHEISLISTKHVLAALDRNRFDPFVIVIQKNGEMTWTQIDQIQALSDNPKTLSTPKGSSVSIRPYRYQGDRPTVVVDGKDFPFDIAFPLLHGPGGEDGTVQGLFELAQIPVVGCGVKSSAVCMDKGLTKKICMQAGLPVIPFVEVHRGEAIPQLPWTFPLFVKPATLGSSLGVSKVKSPADLKIATDLALSMDEKILIEPGIDGRELEIAILGKRGDLKASPAGEIRCKTEFYSYDAKYVDGDSADLILPASLPAETLEKFQGIAMNIFNALDCRGLARIDFFMDKKGQFLLNEVNTIPGFTPISMYPKLMGLAGVSYSELLTTLIKIACEE